MEYFASKLQLMVGISSGAMYGRAIAMDINLTINPHRKA